MVAADAPLAEEICAPEHREALRDYVAQVRKLTDIERQETDRTKTGVFLGRYAINPVNGERLPVWAADYVLPDYGTGAIMAVPAHDQRDLDFARAFGLPVQVVVDTGEPDPAQTGIATHGDGSLINSGPLDGLSKADAIARITAIVEAEGQGRAAVNYRLRDWLLSRQRFWGTPIPIVYCASCGEVPVADDQLPVVLPDLRGQDLVPKGVSPLAAAEDWVNTECPKCGGPARRDTDTMDTFVDSSWYFLRYCSPHYEHGPFDVAAVRRWAPVDLYVGGVEHAILHLLYSRFFVKVLQDMGMVDFGEPFTRLLNQGQVINRGRAMSKSLGNGVDLGQQLAAHGVDAVRLTMIFASPPEDDIDWADMNPEASVKFLGRVWRIADDVAVAPADTVSRDGVSGDTASGDAASPNGHATGDLGLRKVTHHTIDEVTRLVEASRLNVAVARLMELASATRKAIDTGPGPADPAVREAAETLIVMLSLFAPYTAEECWELLGRQASVALRLAGRRSRAAGRGRGDLRGAGGRQGARPRGSPAWHRRGRAARTGSGHPRGRPGARGAAGTEGHRPRAQAGQRRPGLTGPGLTRAVLPPAQLRRTPQRPQRRLPATPGPLHPAQTRRSTATTRPRIAASSPGIGVYSGLCGISHTCSPERLKVFTVASPSIMAATMSPFSATGCCRTTTQSPSAIAALIMESPTTLSRKSVPSPTICLGSGKMSSIASSARIGPPAAIRPTSGT